MRPSWPPPDLTVNSAHIIYTRSLRTKDTNFPLLHAVFLCVLVVQVDEQRTFTRPLGGLVSLYRKSHGFLVDEPRRCCAGVNYAIGPSAPIGPASARSGLSLWLRVLDFVSTSTMPVTIEEELDVDFSAIHPPAEPFNARTPIVIDLLAEKSDRGHAARQAVARREGWLERDLALVEDAVQSGRDLDVVLGLASKAGEHGLPERCVCTSNCWQKS